MFYLKFNRVYTANETDLFSGAFNPKMTVIQNIIIDK